MDQRRLPQIALCLSAIGAFVFVYIYVAIIIVGDVLYNPLTNGYIPLAVSIPFAAYLNGYGASPQAIPGQLFVGDMLLFAGILLAFFGSLLYHLLRTKNLRYAIGKPLLNYSMLIAILVFVPVYALRLSLGAIYHIAPYLTGFPEPSISVTTSTCFIKMADWSVFAPYCYFLNYGQLLIISIAAAAIGYLLVRSATARSGKGRKNERVGFYDEAGRGN